jgi:hypothetical protein
MPISLYTDGSSTSCGTSSDSRIITDHAPRGRRLFEHLLSVQGRLRLETSAEEAQVLRHEGYWIDAVKDIYDMRGSKRKRKLEMLMNAVSIVIFLRKRASC